MQAAEPFWSWELQKLKSDVPPEQDMLQISEFNIHFKWTQISPDPVTQKVMELGNLIYCATNVRKKRRKHRFI